MIEFPHKLHDLKNSLTLISLQIELLRELAAKHELSQTTLCTHLTLLDAGTKQTLATLQELITPEFTPPGPIDLSTLAAETIKLACAPLQRQTACRHARIELRTDLDPTPAVIAQATSLRDALINLLMNAADAIAHHGVVTVSTTVSDGHVHLTVADSGCGIANTTKAQLFSPGFTTKGARGTGFGLCSVKHAVERYGGRVTIESRPRAGTTVTLSFPIACVDPPLTH